MSDRLNQLTTIFLGLLLLAFGMYIQINYATSQSQWFWSQKFPRAEGFQTTDATVTSPASTSSTTPLVPKLVLPSAEASTTLNTAEEGSELVKKTEEIRTTYRLVSKNKPKQDLTLNSVLDSEIINTIDTILEEIKFFDPEANIPEYPLFSSNLNKFNNLTEKQKDVIRTMIYSAEQQAAILKYIYITLPSMIIASNIVVNSENSSPDSLNDPTVVTELKQSIMSALSGMPRIAEKMEQKTKELLSTVNNFTGDNMKSKEFTTNLQSVFRDYYRIVNIRVQSYKKTISLQKSSVSKDSAAGKTAADIQKTNSNLVILIQTATNFIDLSIQTIQSVKDKVDQAVKMYPMLMELTTLKNVIDTSIQSLNLTKTTIAYSADIGVIKPAEGFTSVGNPYNASTPNIQQALSFRLGKRQLVDEVSATSKV